jgi:periplasmic divalent cation tolerance protein
MEPADGTAAAYPSPSDHPGFVGVPGFNVTAFEPAIGSPGGGPDRMVCVVLTSEATLERADALARALVEQRLVACVSVLPVRSHYRWQGALETADEVKLLLKTTPEQLSDLHQALHDLHGYQTPEWIVLGGISRGDYGLWLGEQLG